MCKYFLILLALIGTVIYAKAERMDGNFLLKMCTTQTEEARAGCAGYVLGYADATVMWQANVKGISICIPSEEVNTKRITDVVVKWLKEHPRNIAAAIMVADAFEHEWPCKES